MEDATSYLKAAAFLNLILAFVLLLPQGYRFSPGVHEVLCTASAALILLHLRYGPISSKLSNRLVLAGYCLLLGIDLYHWVPSMDTSMNGHYSKGLLMEGLRASLPGVYALLRAGSVLCFLPLLTFRNLGADPAP